MRISLSKTTFALMAAPDSYFLEALLRYRALKEGATRIPLGSVK